LKKFWLFDWYRHQILVWPIAALRTEVSANQKGVFSVTCYAETGFKQIGRDSRCENSIKARKWRWRFGNLCGRIFQRALSVSRMLSLLWNPMQNNPLLTTLMVVYFQNHPWTSRSFAPTSCTTRGSPNTLVTIDSHAEILSDVC